MFDKFMPDADLGSVFLLTPEILNSFGARGVVFDIDNTLVYHRATRPNEQVKKMLKKLEKAGFRLALVSNNSAERADSVGECLGIKAFGKAGKPKKSALAAPLEKLGLDPSEVVFVGDQLLTDCLCAKRNGMKFILVKPIDPYENPLFFIKRLIEKPLLKIYRSDKKK